MLSSANSSIFSISRVLKASTNSRTCFSRSSIEIAGTFLSLNTGGEKVMIIIPHQNPAFNSMRPALLPIQVWRIRILFLLCFANFDEMKRDYEINENNEIYEII